MARFATYHENLLQINEDRRATAALIDRRNVVEKVTTKLIKHTTFVDGSSDVSTPTWIDDMDLAHSRVGDQHIIDIVTSSVTGSLRKEGRVFFLQNVWTASNVAREAVPWMAMRLLFLTQNAVKRIS